MSASSFQVPRAAIATDVDVNGIHTLKVTGTVTTSAGTSGTVTHTTPALSAVSGQVAAANASRIGLRIRNNGTVRVYLVEGAGPATVSTTAADDYIDPGDEYKTDYGFTGAIQAISDPAPAGNLLVREYTP